MNETALQAQIRVTLKKAADAFIDEFVSLQTTALNSRAKELDEINSRLLAMDADLALLRADFTASKLESVKQPGKDQPTFSDAVAGFQPLLSLANPSPQKTVAVNKATALMALRECKNGYGPGPIAKGFGLPVATLHVLRDYCAWKTGSKTVKQWQEGLWQSKLAPVARLKENAAGEIQVPVPPVRLISGGEAA